MSMRLLWFLNVACIIMWCTANVKSPNASAVEARLLNGTATAVDFDQTELPNDAFWPLPTPSMYQHQIWHVQQQQQQQQKHRDNFESKDELETRGSQQEDEQPQQQQQHHQEQQQLPKESTRPQQEKSEKLDIYLNYASPRRLSYGHVEATPQRVERRFGMRDEGNRYKGMVIWADRQGGYGEHQWDLAQGAI